MHRALKQIIIGAVFLGLILALTSLIVLAFRENPTCTDGIKNGKEDGIDCGVLACGYICEEIEPISVISTKIIPVSAGDYDIVAEINNPNGNYGSGEVVYSILLGDQKFVSGTFYILPGETKFVVSSIKSDSEIKEASFVINSVNWQRVRFNNASTFGVRTYQFRKIGTGEVDLIPEEEFEENFEANENINVSNEVDAIVFNNSSFDFDTVDIAVILWDVDGNIIAVNSTTINSFLSASDRYFKVTWPFDIDGQFERAEIQISTNVFNDSNYLKNYGGSSEKFQKFY